MEWFGTEKRSRAGCAEVMSGDDAVGDIWGILRLRVKSAVFNVDELVMGPITPTTSSAINRVTHITCHVGIKHRILNNNLDAAALQESASGVDLARDQICAP